MVSQWGQALPLPRKKPFIFPLQRYFWCWRESSMGLLPLPVPPAQQAGAAVPQPPPASPSLGTGSAPREAPLQSGRCHEMRNWSNTQPAQPADGPGGCRALPCTAHPWLQLRVEPRCQTGEYSPALAQGKEGCSWEILGFFFMQVVGRLWWSWRNSSGIRAERNPDFFPSSLRKSNLRKFIHDQHTAIAHNFVNGNLVIHNTCVGDICSGVIQY